MIKIVENHFGSFVLGKQNEDLSLNRFSLAYRNSVDNPTNESLAKLTFRRHLRTRLD